VTQYIERAGILTIGNEVLDGLVLDTNTNWIETRIHALGLEMRKVVGVRDEIEEIGQGLHSLMDACDVIFTSGGLGPTHDDMTLAAIGKALGLQLREDKIAIEMIQKRYVDLYQKGIIATDDMTESRRKMGIVPEGSVLLANEVGAAPGVRINYRDRYVFCLPGVPSELKSIWENSIQPWLREHIKGGYYQEIIELDFIDESIFSPVIDSVMRDVPGVWIKSMPKRYGTSRVMRVWISARSEEQVEAVEDVGRAVKTLEKETGLQARRIEE
jgi:nicotinamide-nucleotide amidase